MKIINERESTDTIFDIDVSDSEAEILTTYGRKHITDEALIQFAMVHILTKQIERDTLVERANLVNDLLANAAVLGCPDDKDVDMWYRDLTDDERCEIVERLDLINSNDPW